MSVGISFTLCSFFFIALLTIVFFSKKRLVSTENKIYSYIILTSLFGTVIGVPCYYFMQDYEIFGLANDITARAYLVYIITWLTLFTGYIFLISIKRINKKLISKIFISVYLILVLIACTLPLYYENKNGMVYSYGPAANFTYLGSGIGILIILICLIINIKHIKQKKFIPLIAFITIGTAVTVIQKFNPGLHLITFGEAFITFLMYFTIENPDVKMIQELSENRQLVEKTNEEKSNFLFNMTAEVKNPVNYIYQISSELIEENDINKLKKGISTINKTSNKLSYLINDVLNVNSLDAKKLKIVNSTYNIYNMVDEIKARLKSEEKEKVEFRYNISENIPKSLHGDVIKLKQVLMTILLNSVKYTKEGFVEFSILPMIKYDTCRLIITIEDSGVGMDLAKVNDLLKDDEELTENDLKKLGNIDLNINIVRKIIKYLDGTMMIKSEEDKGSEFIITIDQKIEDEKNNSEYIKYDNEFSKGKKVLLVDDDINELNLIKEKLEKENLNVTTALYGKDAIDKVNFKEKFELIIIDDEMPEYSGYDTLKELNKIKGFNTNVIIMLNKDKEFIKNHYIEDGFADYLLKDNLNNEIKKIIDKYL